MAKFYHVGLGFVGQTIGVETIQKSFGSAGWARYAPNCWIIYTDESPVELRERLRKLCSPMDSIFICELNMNNKVGYLQQEIWDWISKKT